MPTNTFSGMVKGRRERGDAKGHHHELLSSEALLSSQEDLEAIPTSSEVLCGIKPLLVTQEIC